MRNGHADEIARLIEPGRVHRRVYADPDIFELEMERIFGVSYPTIKNRLNRIANSLDFVDTDPAPSRSDVIDRLKRGEITAPEAIRDAVSASMWTRQRATARRMLGSLAETSTMRARPSGSRWVNSEAIPAF